MLRRRTSARARRCVHAVAIVLVAVSTSSAVLASPAVAQVADFHGHVSCTGEVTFDAAAGPAVAAAGRETPDVRVLVGGHEVARGEFSAANDYRISGTYQLPEPLPAATQITVTWREQAAPGVPAPDAPLGTRSSPRIPVPACAPEPGPTAVAGVSAAPSGAGALPFTGGQSMVLSALAGAALVGLGAALHVGTRRHRRRDAPSTSAG